MHRTRAVAALLLLTTALVGGGAEPNLLTPEEQAAGWKLLFDGKTTQGWRSFKRKEFPAKGWVVTEGCLKHETRAGGGDIISEGEFDQFDLQWEWKIAPRANSGLKYFVTERRSSALGHEYQMIDEGPAPKSDYGSTASFYVVVPPAKDKQLNPPGQWNHSRVLVKGNHVEHWLNGAKVLQYELGSPELLAAVAKSKFKGTPGFGTRLKGHILLQDHGGEVLFRNLKIRDLNAP